ncbi:S1C family serine protease [Azohydromonas sp.]|uniref:S1C family serine protease n=1 Tax=Azohydromonas sp. TaxID=1872666 RepID=UPI002D1FBACE|nr:S1C family serine protease [Azohydromonas sp.]
MSHAVRIVHKRVQAMAGWSDPGLRGVRLALLACCLALSGLTAADDGRRTRPAFDEATTRALERAARATVGVRATAVDDARSVATLGRQREGSGVVIDADGLVLTIGYVVLEAEQVRIEVEPGREVPARVVAYDLATGFGLLRPLVPLRVEPAPLAGARAATDDALMVTTGGSDAVVGVARLMSQRPFSGYWEYHIEHALFTAPPLPRHSGAGLFNLKGELLGIGSLAVADTLPADDPRSTPGNMFVPVELLRPVLDELLARGTSAPSRRAWLGLNCVEQRGQVRVVRVSEDSPAEAGGVRVGDRIVRIDGADVSTLDTLWKALWTGGGPEREVRLEVRRGDDTHTLRLQSVDRQSTLRRARGI